MRSEQMVPLLLALLCVTLFVLTGIALAERKLGWAAVLFLSSFILIGSGMMLRRRRG